MSGIAGIIRFHGNPVDREQIETMTAAMACRGPDGRRHWIKDSVALGHCMMRTTPESLEEQQPLTNEDESLVLIMDGRVDNWEELRGKLLSKGAILRTHADAELVLRAYEVWGGNCLTHIEGDFALAIWDDRKHELFAARDHLGNRPFTYYFDGQTLVFASELRAILGLPWIPAELNFGMVAEFIGAEWVTRDETFWKGIRKLPSAHKMSVRLSKLTLDEYWRPDLSAHLDFDDEQEAAEHYRSLLVDTVRKMSRSQAPIAFEVSGGLDSSALFAVAENLRRRSALLSPGLCGYTMEFPDDGPSNELDYCRDVEEYVGQNVRKIPASFMPLDWYRDQACLYREFPSFPNGVMALGIRQHAQREGQRALISGAGADQWLCGTQAYYAEAIADGRWREFRQCIATDIEADGLLKTTWAMIRYGFYPMLPEGAQRRLRKLLYGDKMYEIDANRWLTPLMKSTLKEQRRKIEESSPFETSRITQRRQLATLKSAFGIQACEIEERMAAMAGIELRRPFYSKALVQFAFSTREHLRARGGIDKYLHRQSMTGLLPERVLQRKSKAQFGIVYFHYREQFKALAQNGFFASSRGWVEQRDIEELLEHTGKDALGDWPMFILWCLFGCLKLSEFP